MKIIMLKGLPGSGKSTYAKELCAKDHSYVRVNKDDLRSMMSNYRPGKDEELILLWRDRLITEALWEEKNVIVDDTNFHPKHEERLRKIAWAVGGLMERNVDFEVLTVNTPLDECIRRDARRPVPVGEKVIKRMWRDYVRVEPPTVWIDSKLPWAIICDLDGTLAIHAGRSPYDVAKCDTDILNRGLIELIRKYQDHALILVTGREDKYRDLTNHWLERHEIFRQDLFMRATGDMRSDDIVKQEIYEANIKGKYNIQFVLDDRNRVVDMWRRNGLTCLQVAEGDF